MSKILYCILMNFPSPAAPEVFKMTTSSAGINENFFEVTFIFQCNLIARGIDNIARTKQSTTKPCACIMGILYTKLILGLRPPNERRRYFVTTSLIGWMQA